MKRFRIGRTTFLFLFLFATFSNGANAQLMELTTDDMGSSGPSKMSAGLKFAYHTFWTTGMLADGRTVNRPNLSTSDLAGVGMEMDLNYEWKPTVVFTATLGGYEGGNASDDISVVSIYGLVTAKLINRQEFVHYYVGAGLGGYFGFDDLDESSSAFKPGAHVLAGFRIPLTPAWSILIEDRLAFALRAKGGFHNLDLGGNFAMVGCEYDF